MINNCPGAAGMRTPTISIKICPVCRGEVEMFSSDIKMDCPSCGQTVFNNVNSCVDYCTHAEQCLGTDTYNRIKKKNQGGIP